MAQDSILILDLGGGENERVAKAVRNLGVLCEIKPHGISRGEVKAMPGVRGIIVGGIKHMPVGGKRVDIEPWLIALGLPMLFLDHPVDLLEVGDPALVTEASMPDEDDTLRALLRLFVLGDCEVKAI